MKNKINICIATDENYSKFSGVLIASILASSDFETRHFFYILDGGISEERKKELAKLKSIKEFEIEYLKVDNSLFKDFDKIQTHSYITTPAYYRLKLGSLLKNIDRIIYFDCDVIVNCDLAEFFNTEMENCAIAGVKDINHKILKKNPNYINSGVLLFDLEKYRRENIEEKLFSYVNKNFNNIKMGDQEVINTVLKDKIKLLPDEFNVQSSNFVNRSSYTNNPKIIHFVSRKKPWHFASYSYHKKYYFKFLQLTPWKISEKEIKFWLFKNEIASLVSYFKYRPFFILRPRFYKAIFCTYIKPLLKGEKIA